MQLRPVTYQLDITGIQQRLNGNKKLDANELKSVSQKENIIQSGFVAQEVEQAAKKLGYNFSGVDTPKNSNDLYGLRYSEFVVPLVKAVQEQQQIIENQNKKIDQLQKQLETLLKDVQQLKTKPN